VHVDHPFSIDQRGRTATTNRADHIRDLIEQVLFTAQGERVNRPGFGAGVERLVFAPNGEELAASVKAVVQGAVQQWLADVIVVDGVSVAHDENRIEITVVYTDAETGDRRAATFARDV
jgi:phage baseplate assembly protein W